MNDIIIKYPHTLPIKLYKYIEIIGKSRIDGKPIYKINRCKYKKVWKYIIDFNSIEIQRKIKINTLLNKHYLDELNDIEKLIFEFFSKDYNNIELISFLEDYALSHSKINKVI